MSEHQKQKATGAGFVAAASGGGDELADFKAGQVAAPGLAAGGLSGSGRPARPYS